MTLLFNLSIWLNWWEVEQATRFIHIQGLLWLMVCSFAPNGVLKSNFLADCCVSLHFSAFEKELLNSQSLHLLVLNSFASSNKLGWPFFLQGSDFCQGTWANFFCLSPCCVMAAKQAKSVTNHGYWNNKVYKSKYIYWKKVGKIIFSCPPNYFAATLWPHSSNVEAIFF